MALTSMEANAVVRLIAWARGGHPADDRYVVTDEAATEDARLLARSANRSMHSSPNAREDVTLRWTHTVRERLLQLRADEYVSGQLTPVTSASITVILDVLDGIDRQEAATAAATENG